MRRSGSLVLFTFVVALPRDCPHSDEALRVISFPRAPDQASLVAPT